MRSALADELSLRWRKITRNMDILPIAQENMTFSVLLSVHQPTSWAFGPDALPCYATQDVSPAGAADTCANPVETGVHGRALSICVGHQSERDHRESCRESPRSDVTQRPRDVGWRNESQRAMPRALPERSITEPGFCRVAGAVSGRDAVLFGTVALGGLLAVRIRVSIHSLSRWI